MFAAAGARSETFDQQVLQVSQPAAAAARQTRQDFPAAQTRKAGPSAKDRETLQAAREAYYTVAAAGFGGFKADVQVDWEHSLGRPLTDGERQTFGGFKFQVSVDARGVAKVTSKSSIVEEQVRASFDQIATGLDELLGGFFQTWSGFMIARPLPASGSAFQLQREEKLYRLSYKNGNAAVSTALLKNFAVTKIEEEAPDYKSVIKPVFSATEDGFVLASYDATYVPTSGPGNTGLKVEIEYQDADGVRLPNKITLDSSYDGQSNRTRVELKNFTVQKRQASTN